MGGYPADPVSTGHFIHNGYRLVYDEYGDGPRPIVLLPGLLLPRHMHDPLARALADRGNRVFTLDLLAHGQSDHPTEMWHYSMQLFAEQAIALLDHLELDQAVVGGTSLGANVTLEVAALAPDRLRGAIVEMPVLDNALLACALAFTPLLVGLTFGAPLARVLSAVAKRVPRGLGHLPDVGLDWVSQDPKSSAAVLQGLFFGRIAPPRAERRDLETRTLVLGHGRDPIHPFSDADELVAEMPKAQLVEANSLFELRLAPDRLTNEIAAFVEGCWRPTSAAPRGGARGSGRSRRASA